MNVTRLPEEQFPQPDKALLERLPVAEIIEQVNAVLRAHGLEAQLTNFSVMHQRFANCTCAEPRWWPVCKDSDGRCRASKWSAMIPV
jgi:hypothetical protein